MIAPTLIMPFQPEPFSEKQWAFKYSAIFPQERQVDLVKLPSTALSGFPGSFTNDGKYLVHNMIAPYIADDPEAEHMLSLTKLNMTDMTYFRCQATKDRFRNRKSMWKAMSSPKNRDAVVYGVSII